MTSILVIEYRGYQIRKFGIGTRTGELFIQYKNGVISPIACRNVKVAKKIIDTKESPEVTVWDAIETIYPGVEEYKRTA